MSNVPFQANDRLDRPAGFNIGIFQKQPQDPRYLVLGFCYDGDDEGMPRTRIAMLPQEAFDLSDELLRHGEDLQAGSPWPVATTVKFGNHVPHHSNRWVTRPAAATIRINMQAPEDPGYLYLGFYYPPSNRLPEISIPMFPHEALDVSNKLLERAEDLQAGLTWL